jgi:hypothetical protein
MGEIANLLRWECAHELFFEIVGPHFFHSTITFSDMLIRKWTPVSLRANHSAAVQIVALASAFAGVLA